MTFHFIAEQRMIGSSGVRRNANHLPGILSRGRPEKRGHQEKTGQGSASSDPVAFFFKNADLICLLEKKLDVESLQRLASVNRRLRDVLGKHYDLEFMQQHWAPHMRRLNGYGRMYGNATRGFTGAESKCEDAIRKELVEFFEHHQPTRNIERVLQFVYAPGGPRHAHARRFIEEHLPFLLVSTMRMWTRTMRIFYYEEFMWQVCASTNNVGAAIHGERFLEMVTALEEMAHKDGKHRFDWNGERLARPMLSVRWQFASLREQCLQKRVFLHDADLATRTIAWIDARVPQSRAQDLLPRPRVGVVYAHLAMPHEHAIAGNIVADD